MVSDCEIGSNLRGLGLRGRARMGRDPSGPGLRGGSPLRGPETVRFDQNRRVHGVPGI